MRSHFIADLFEANANQTLIHSENDNNHVIAISFALFSGFALLSLLVDVYFSSMNSDELLSTIIGPMQAHRQTAGWSLHVPCTLYIGFLRPFAATVYPLRNACMIFLTGFYKISFQCFSPWKRPLLWMSLFGTSLVYPSIIAKIVHAAACVSNRRSIDIDQLSLQNDLNKECRMFSIIHTSLLYSILLSTFGTMSTLYATVLLICLLPAMRILARQLKNPSLSSFFENEGWVSWNWLRTFGVVGSFVIPLSEGLAFLNEPSNLFRLFMNTDDIYMLLSCLLSIIFLNAFTSYAVDVGKSFGERSMVGIMRSDEVGANSQAREQSNFEVGVVSLMWMIDSLVLVSI